MWSPSWIHSSDDDREAVLQITALSMAALNGGSTETDSCHFDLAGVCFALPALLAWRKQFLSPKSLAKLCWSVVQIGPYFVACRRAEDGLVCKTLIDMPRIPAEMQRPARFGLVVALVVGPERATATQFLKLL